MVERSFRDGAIHEAFRVIEPNEASILGPCAGARPLRAQPVIGTGDPSRGNRWRQQAADFRRFVPGRNRMRERPDREIRIGFAIPARPTTRLRPDQWMHSFTWPVLFAAVLHAAWNSLVKAKGDHFSLLLMLTFTHAAISALGLLAVPAPAVGAIPWIAAGAILHTGYKVFLSQAYAHADLSQAYPLARGYRPAPRVPDFRPSLRRSVPAPWRLPPYWRSRSAYCSWPTGENGEPRMQLTSLGWAVGTAAFISGYTIVGGNGARIAGTASGFLFWLVIGDALGMTAWALLHRGTAALSAVIPVWKAGAAAGAIFAVCVLDRHVGLHGRADRPRSRAAGNEYPVCNGSRIRHPPGTGQCLAVDIPRDSSPSVQFC